MVAAMVCQKVFSFPLFEENFYSLQHSTCVDNPSHKNNLCNYLKKAMISCYKDEREYDSRDHWYYIQNCCATCNEIHKILHESKMTTVMTTDMKSEMPTETTTEIATEMTTEMAIETTTETTTEMTTDLTTEMVTEMETEMATELTTETAKELATDSVTEMKTEMPTETATEMATEMMRTEMTTEINEGQTKSPEYDVEEQTESIEKDTLTIESQTKFPEYDVKETTEGSENGPEYEDEYDGEVFYPEEIKDNSIKEVTTNHYLKNDTLTTEGQTKFPEYDVKETTEGTENGSEYEDEIDIEFLFLFLRHPVFKYGFWIPSIFHIEDTSKLDDAGHFMLRAPCRCL